MVKQQKLKILKNCKAIFGTQKIHKEFFSVSEPYHLNR
jgi:hypothetical protein